VGNLFLVEGRAFQLTGCQLGLELKSTHKQHVTKLVCDFRSSYSSFGDGISFGFGRLRWADDSALDLHIYRDKNGKNQQPKQIHL